VRCSACGAACSDGGKCPRCGSHVSPSSCTHCGFVNSSLANFCGGCGRPIGVPFASGVTPVEAHTPRYLADRILRARAAIQGERKLVTVMFADLRGSFELIEGTDPERAQAVFDSTIRLMTAAVHRYDGTVAQILGDGIVAIFGAPIAHEDHAVRAAYAALAMQDAAGARTPGTDADATLRRQIRIGLNSGEVVIGAIGNDLSLNYRAVGPTTHMAARMEQTAFPGTTRLTGETLRLADGLLQVRPLGPTTVKGVSQPVEIYELVGRTNRTRFQAHIDRGLSPFVGREVELQALRTALSDVVNGTSRTVVVEGDAGSGKSRLCHELVSDAGAVGCDVLETTAVDYGQAPFAMLGQLLRAELEVGPDTSAAVLQGALDAELDRFRQLTAARSALASVLDLPIDDPEWLGLDPAVRRQRSFAAMRALLAARFVQRPLILLIEDLHWFDEESRAFVGTLVHESPPGGRLVLLTHRSELRLDLGRSPDRVCRLLALPESSSRALVASLVGAAPDLEPLRAKLVERTDGNPFFIEETVRVMIESGVLVGLPGAHKLASPKTTFDIPPSVESLIAARIDRLAPAHKELLTAAAVIGDEMPRELLQSVLGLPDEEFGVRLDGAEVLGILIEAKLFPARLCRFRHSLIREVLYRQMLSPQRRELHARAVSAIELLYADRLAEHLEVLAAHAFEGGIWEKAADYYQRACVRAATRWANRDAVSLLDRGLESLERLPAGDVRTRAGIDLRLAGFAPLLPLGDQARMVALLREAEAMAETLGDRRRLGAVYSQLATILWMSGRHDLARQSADKALTLAEEHQIFALRKAALHNLGMVLHARADFARAIEIHRRLVDEFTGELERKRFGWAGYPSVMCRTFLGSSLTFVGKFDEAFQVFSEGCRIADELDHPYSRAIVQEESGFWLLTTGRFDEALATLERAFEISRENQVYTMYPAIAGRLAVALAECGRAAEGIEIAQDALARETYRLGGNYARNYLLLGLATSCLRAGRLEQALEAATRGEALAGAAQEHAHHASILLLLGEIYATCGPASADDAERSLQAALTLATRHGMRPLEAECHRNLGTLYRDSRRQDAVRELAEAARAYDSLGLTERRGQVL